MITDNKKNVLRSIIIFSFTKDIQCFRNQDQWYWSFFLLLPLRSQLHLWGSPDFGEIFAYVTVSFSSNHRGSHIPSSRRMQTGCVFVAGIHPSRT